MAAYYPLDNDDGNYAKGKMIENLKDPEFDTSAVNKRYLKNNALILNEDDFDARNKKIRNLSNPIKSSDAVHKLYVDRRMKINDKKPDNLLTRDNDGLYVPSFIKKGIYHFGNLRITGVANPIINRDVATKEYVDSQNFYATIQERYASYTTGGFQSIHFNLVSSKLLEPNLKLTKSMYMKITLYLHSERNLWKPLIRIEIDNQLILSTTVIVNESLTCFAYGKRNDILKISISSDGDSNEIKPYLHVEKIEFL